MDFANVLQTLDGFLRERGLRYAVVGAFALHAHGITRATADLDVAVESAARLPLIAFLEAQGYDTLHASAGYSNHVHRLGAAGRVDCLYVSGPTADQLFSGSRPLLRLGGGTYPVPRAEHLAAMKVFAIKNAPERTHRDLADLQELLRVPGIDREEVRRYFEKRGLERLFREIAGEDGRA